MSGLKKSPYFNTKESDNDKKLTLSSSAVVSCSTPYKAIKKRSSTFKEPVLTKRTCSHYFERDNTNLKNKNATKSDCTITAATTDLQNFDSILREFKAARSLLRGVDNIHTVADIPHNVSAELQENDEEITCPICLCHVMINERAGPDSCAHNSFCFSCLVAWGNVINKCPLCKSTFTKVISTSYPQRVERFDTTFDQPITASDMSDDEEHDDVEGVHVEGNEIRPLYGYDDSDGFVVGEDVVEYASSGDDNDLLNF